MGVILLLAVPIAAAVVAFVLRRWRILPPLLAAAVSLLLGLVLLWVPFDRPVVLLGREVTLGGTVALLGRTLVLGPSAQAVMVFSFLTGAVLFLLSWQVESEELFAPLGLGLLGLLGGVLVVRPLIYAVLLLQIAAVLSILPLHSDPRLPVRGGLRYLTFFTLALPGLLVSHWLLDQYAVTPDQVGFLYTATALIGFSFALMLGVVPFHSWLPAVGRDGAPLATAFLFSISGGVVWFLLLDYLQTYPWLSSHPQWSSVLTALGLLTASVGGLLAMTRRGPGVLIGYAVIVDTGVLLVALGQLNLMGIELGMATVFARALGVALMAAGMAGLHVQRKGVGQAIDGLGLRAPWSTAALMVGGLSLAGFPPAVGFVARWGLYRLLFRGQPLVALLLLLASAGLFVGLLRLFLQLLSKPAESAPRYEDEQEQEQEKGAVGVREPLAFSILVLALIAGTIALGLFPQGLMAVAARVGAAFTFFVP